MSLSFAMETVLTGLHYGDLLIADFNANRCRCALLDLKRIGKSSMAAESVDMRTVNALRMRGLIRGHRGSTRIYVLTAKGRNEIVKRSLDK